MLWLNRSDGTRESSSFFPLHSRHDDTSSIRQMLASLTSAGAGDAELQSLSAECDPEMFYFSLMNWAERRERGAQPERAVAAYQLLNHAETVPAEIRRQATERLAVLSGGGPWPERAEHFVHSTFDQVLTPPNLLAMAGAGLAFRTSRLAFLRFFSEAGLSRAPLSIAAAGAAFNLEALSFPLLHRLAHQTAGHRVDWNPSQLGRDFLSSYLFLGGMRAAGFGAGKFLQWRSAAPGARSLFAPNLGTLTSSQSLVRLSSVFGGVLAWTYLETLAGLKHFDSAGAFLSHSLATFVQFQVAGSITSRALGPRFSRLERRMDLIAANWEPVRTHPADIFLTPLPHSLEIGVSGYRPTRHSLNLPQVMAMSQSGLDVAPKLNGRPLTISESGREAPAMDIVPNITRTPHFSAMEALVRHRGNLSAAAQALDIAPAEFERFLMRENAYSELNVFQNRYGGRMLFYRPALARAHEKFGETVYSEKSLRDLKLTLPTFNYVQRLGAHSLYDLLLLTRHDFFNARRPNESTEQISTSIEELELKFNQSLANEAGRVFENHPFEEGAVKFLFGKIHGHIPITDLGLPPATESYLHNGGLQTIGDLMNRPIPTWISRESLPETSRPGTREARLDEVIRSLFASLHGAGPRRYRPPVPDARTDF